VGRGDKEVRDGSCCNVLFMPTVESTVYIVSAVCCFQCGLRKIVIAIMTVMLCASNCRDTSIICFYESTTGHTVRMGFGGLGVR
jgi:hypothetical protein